MKFIGCVHVLPSDKCTYSQPVMLIQQKQLMKKGTFMDIFLNMVEISQEVLKHLFSPHSFLGSYLSH